MFEMGCVVGLGLLFSLAKMSWQWKLRILSSPVMMDAIIFAALLVLHWGTFSGVMVATIGALMCSMVLSMGRWLIGFMEHGKYVPGKFDMAHKLQAA